MSRFVAVSAAAALSPAEPCSKPEPKKFRQVIPLEDARPRLRVIPFRSGARPGHEALAPGEGCSLHIGLFDSRDAREEDSGALWLLYALHPGLGRHRVQESLRVRLSVWLLPDCPEDGGPLALPGLLCHEVPLCQPSCANEAQLVRAEAPPAGVSHGCYVAALPYAAVREGLARLGAAGAEAFSLAHLFHRRFRVLLELCAGDKVLSCDSTEVELYDLGRFGSLYQRVLDGLVRPDTDAQAARRGAWGLFSMAHHPWYPVLTIGMDKARLYLEAIESDVSRHTTHLPDPRWLVRVGLYLELLTVLGILEAVRDEYPDLLSAEERHQLETAPALAPIRERLDVAAWREVWELRHIAVPSRQQWWGRVVEAGNLLRKQRATLAFLEAHHEDLERALELAGPALGGTHATWLRVFQDAERAVLRNVDAVFPELRILPAQWREWVLWRECGDFVALGLGRLPGWLSRCVGDRGGLFASASREYRRSMNAVAHRARERGWMDYVGGECVPREASLIEPRLGFERMLRVQRAESEAAGCLPGAGLLGLVSK
ncbi:hypothetical protein [Archangium lansingense]|uniref:Uncharacterized protein n=1 Tax=Archangium lansingense TaxID=2995310 RepID=A0ABT3ZUC2_9BACT|nr:hypothetical protein [Archangium lansinium]MCY1072911.1 hypothetical protein [Archangium lansinium]